MFIKYQFDPKIATYLNSAEKAFIVEFIAWSIKSKTESATNSSFGKENYASCYHEGDYYMWDTYDTWKARMPWMSVRTLKRYISDLKDEGLIKTAFLHPDPRNRTMYYTIDFDKYVSIATCENDTPQGANLSPLKVTDLHFLPSNTHTNTHTKSTPSPNGEAPLSSSDQSSVIKDKTTDFQKALALEWIEHAKKHQPWNEKRFKVEKYADGIRRIQNSIKVSDEHMTEMLRWIKQDQFWCDKAISPMSLLSKSKNGLRKLDNVLTAMKPKSVNKRIKIEQTMKDLEHVKWEDL
jgi:hypothetical protein